MVECRFFFFFFFFFQNCGRKFLINNQMEKSKKLNAQELKIYMYIRGRKILWKSVESEESSRCT